MDSGKQYVTTKAIKEAVRRATNSGGPKFIEPGSHLVYPTSSIDVFLNKRQRRSTSDLNHRER